jgi:sporulation protein YlmC with PRC-barrel domain
MTQVSEAYEWRARTMVDAQGEKLGKIEQIYLDQQSGRPEWALVNTGLFGTKSSFVPLAGASASAKEIRVDVDRDRVKDAPQVDPDEELSQQEEAELFRHYGVPYDEGGTVTAEGTAGGSGGRARG